MADSANSLIGKCPVCSANSGAAAADISDAYVTETLVDSDKYVPLLWSEHYQDHVCRVCLELGKDKDFDDLRNDNDVLGEQERQKMGFVKNYTTN